MKSIRFLSLLTLLAGMLFPDLAANAQTKTVTIKGSVKDEAGDPVSAATIQVLPSGAQTISGADGAFSIAISDSSRQIKVTSVSYAPQTVDIEKGQGVIQIVLLKNAVDIDEVVVVGYGTQKKSDVTNAVSSLDFKDLENVPQTSVLNMLSGRMPGLSVVQLSGQPGDDESEVNVRGVSTIGNASPLVIIDGIQATLKDLSTLMPSEISNVSLLKDASSTAIYGARGANGVILVTTKTPKAGQLRININGYYGLQEATYKPQFVQSWQWMILHNEASGQQLFPEYAIENVRNGIYNDTFTNNNPVPHVFRQAPQKSGNVSVSGGTKAVSFQAALGYLSQEGVLYGTNSKRYNYRANLMANISSKIEMGMNVSGYLQQTHEPYGSVNGILTNLYRNYPITPEKYSNGDWGIQNLYNRQNILPARLYAEIGRTDNDNRRTNVQSYLLYKPFKGLQLKTNAAYTNTVAETERFNPTYQFAAPGGAIASRNNVNTLINQNEARDQLQISTTANYNTIIRARHRLALLAGHEYTGFWQSTFSGRGSDLPTNDQQVLSRATTNIQVSGSKQLWALQSFFGRMNYVFDEKYLLEANFRTDGSSRFPADIRYSFFPSFSAGWIVSKEKFLSALVDNRMITHLKLRASWGHSGNDQIGNYAYIQTLSLGNYYFFGSQVFPGAAISSFSNANVRWEKSVTTNLGIDMGLFRNKLSITFDWYDKVTSDILYRVPLPPSFGDANPAVQNIAKVSNKGFELTLAHRNSIGKFSYDAGVNLSYNNNKILSLNGEETISDRFILREGEEFNAFYGLVYDGVIKDSNELQTVPVLTRNGLEIGSMKFKDLNGDGVINDQDRTIIGSTRTPYTFGFRGALFYKGVDVNFLFQGVEGKQVYVYDWGNRPGNAAIINFWKEWWDNRYDAVNNPGGTWPVMSRSAPGSGNTSSFWVQDGSYIRLKNIELGYTLPVSWTQKATIRRARVYAAAQNLFTWSSLIKQIDPERGSSITANNSYPQIKVFTFGLNLTL